MRKSKFDLFIMYDAKCDRVLEVCWDVAVNGVANWFHFDGEQAWHTTGNAYISQALKEFVLLDRIPESIWRSQ